MNGTHTVNGLGAPRFSGAESAAASAKRGPAVSYLKFGQTAEPEDKLDFGNAEPAAENKYRNLIPDFSMSRGVSSAASHIFSFKTIKQSLLAMLALVVIAPFTAAISVPMGCLAPVAVPLLRGAYGFLKGFTGIGMKTDAKS